MSAVKVSLRYRKRPLVVEAFQMTPARRADNVEWPRWMDEAWQKGGYNDGALGSVDYPNSDGTDKLQIRTKEGIMIVDWNDWIIRGTMGELYPIKPDIFEQVYELDEPETGKRSPILTQSVFYPAPPASEIRASARYEAALEAHHKLAVAVNEYRYRGVHGRDQMGDAYCWPMKIVALEVIAAKALAFVLAGEKVRPE